MRTRAYDGDIAAIEDHADRVLVHFIQRGTPRGGSKPVEEPVYQLWTVRDGLAVRMQMFFDVEDARTALHGGQVTARPPAFPPDVAEAAPASRRGA